MAGAPAGEGGISRDEIRISLGSAIAARYERQKPGPGSRGRVLRGGIGVNVPAPEPDSGLMVNVNMKSLNVDQWIALGNSIAGAEGRTRGARPPAAGSTCRATSCRT